VPSEALRVLQFRDICFANNGRMSDAVLWELGKLMNESHSSCSIDYNCPCPILDELARIYRDAGA
jgi:galactokinase